MTRRERRARSKAWLVRWYLEAREIEGDHPITPELLSHARQEWEEDSTPCAARWAWGVRRWIDAGHLDTARELLALAEVERQFYPAPPLP
jgi:hypothetical protein